MQKLDDDSRTLRELIDLEGLDVRAHAAAIARVANTHPHTIEFIEHPERETCATLALGLTQSPAFMHHLAAQLQLDAPARPEALILYFKGDVWQHVGRVVADGRVRSKWGLYPVYEHAIVEVPARYGDQIAFAAPIDQQQALAHFMDWVRSRGLPEPAIRAAITS